MTSRSLWNHGEKYIITNHLHPNTTSPNVSRQKGKPISTHVTQISNCVCKAQMFNVPSLNKGTTYDGTSLGSWGWITKIWKTFLKISTMPDAWTHKNFIFRLFCFWNDIVVCFCGEIIYLTWFNSLSAIWLLNGFTSVIALIIMSDRLFISP